MVGLLFISGAASLILAVLGFAFSLNGYIYIRVELFLLKIWIAVGFILRGGATSVLAISDPELPGRGRIIAFGVIGLIAGILVLASRHGQEWSCRNRVGGFGVPQHVRQRGALA